MRDLQLRSQAARGAQRAMPGAEPRTVSNGQGLKCSCGRSFKTINSLEQHIRHSSRHTYASAEKALSLTCICGQVLTALDKLRAHQCSLPTLAQASAGRKDSEAQQKKKNMKRKQRKNRYNDNKAEVGSSSSLWYHDSYSASNNPYLGVYDDSDCEYGLCDKDDGWCGCCIDGVGI